jgi:hypothetical protein
VQEDEGKKSNLEDANYNSRTHVVRGFIKHFTTVVCPDTGINPNMYYEKRNKKQSCQTHYQFFANRRGQEFRPFHPLSFILVCRMERPIDLLPNVEFKSGRFIYVFCFIRLLPLFPHLAATGFGIDQRLL